MKEESVQIVLLHAHKITDLADTSPLGIVSQFRLLLSVVMRVFPLATEKQWLALFGQGQFPAEPLNAYFVAHHDKFNLFGDQPFGQVASLVTDKSSPLAKLVPERTSGNNATLFDHGSDSDNTAYTPAEALRMLLVAQSFGLGGLLRAKGVAFGKPFVQPNTTDAVIARGVTVRLTGANLFETLMLNHYAASSDLNDKPFWEEECNAAYFAQPVTNGPMDRYTALSRMVRLIPEINPDGTTVVRRMYFTQGRSFDKTELDPMQCYRQIDKIGIRPILLDEEKASWRDLSALLQVNKASGIRAKALMFIGRVCANNPTLYEKSVRLHVGGIASDKAKVNLWRQDRVNLPAAFLAEDDLVATLKIRLEEAEDAAGQLWQNTRRLCGSFLAPVKGMTKPDSGNVTALATQIDPRPAFWARMETHLPQLLEDMPRPDTADKAVENWRDANAMTFLGSMQAVKKRLGPSPRAWRAAASVSDHLYVKERHEPRTAL